MTVPGRLGYHIAPVRLLPLLQPIVSVVRLDNQILHNIVLIPLEDRASGHLFSLDYLRAMNLQRLGLAPLRARPQTPALPRFLLGSFPLLQPAWLELGLDLLPL